MPKGQCTDSGQSGKAFAAAAAAAACGQSHLQRTAEKKMYIYTSTCIFIEIGVEEKDVKQTLNSAKSQEPGASSQERGRSSRCIEDCVKLKLNEFQL